MQTLREVSVPLWGKTNTSHSCGNKLKSEGWEKCLPGTGHPRAKASLTDSSVRTSYGEGGGGLNYRRSVFQP